MGVWFRGWLLVGGVLVAGCSSARYDAEYAKQVETYRAEAPFAYLVQTPESVGGKLDLRLPRGFTAVPRRQQKQDETTGEMRDAPIDPSRLRPPFVDQFPGYLDTFERSLSVEATNAEYFASVAVGAVPGDGGQMAAIEAAILAQVTADDAFKDAAAAAWGSRELEPLAGGPASWRVLSLDGPQIFEGIVATMPEFKRQPGRCEIWLSADPDQKTMAIIVWRCPDVAAPLLDVPVSRFAELVARTVAFPPEPAEGEPAGDGEDAAAEAAGEARRGGLIATSAGPTRPPEGRGRAGASRRPARG
ncbi:MAG: hypothetical protein RLZZ440_1461 [Planctomycetota bacterium]|jgi:hypothetical protein